MDQDSLWKDYSSLPVNARQEVSDFIAFLRTRYSTRPISVVRDGSLQDEPFIGMWVDRVDMADSTAWVRAVRADDWKRDRD